MARFTAENAELAKEIIARYPRTRSALIPLLHVAQEQDGYVTEDAMEHIAELLSLTPAEVLGTCSFYEMFKREPVGTYLVNVCEGISCMLMGGYELVHHAVLPDLHIHRRLRRLHHREDVAALHLVARLHLPLDELALVHVGAEGGQLELDHANNPFTAATIFSGCGSAASSRCLA